MLTPTNYFVNKNINQKLLKNNDFGIYLNPKTQALLGKYIIFDSELYKNKKNNEYLNFKNSDLDINFIYLIESGLGQSFKN
jgi:hypothetical protein